KVRKNSPKPRPRKSNSSRLRRMTRRSSTAATEKHRFRKFASPERKPRLRLADPTARQWAIAPSKPDRLIKHISMQKGEHLVLPFSCRFLARYLADETEMACQSLWNRI